MLNCLRFYARDLPDLPIKTHKCVVFVVLLLSFFSGCSSRQIENLGAYTAFNALMDSCRACYMLDYEKALYLSTQAIHLADSINYTSGLASAYRFQSIAFIKLGNSEEAIKSLNFALEHAKNSDDSELLGKCYQTKGYIQLELGNLLEGIEATRQSLAYYEEVKNDRKIVEVYCNIGNTYYLDGDYKNSITYLEKALLYSKKCGFEMGAAATLLNLGAAYEKEHDYEKAIYSFELSLKLNKKLDNLEHIIITYINLSTVNLDVGRLDLAQFYIQKADSANHILNSDHLQVRILRVNVKNYLQEGKIELAKLYLDSAQSITQSLAYPVYNLEFDQLYGALFFAMGNYEEAYRHLMLYSQFSDSISAEKGRHRIANMERQRVFEESSLEADNQRNITIGIGVLLLILSISFFSFRLNRMRMKNRISLLEEEKSRVELEKKQVELVSHEIHLSEKKALFQRLLDELVQIRGDQNCPERVGEIISMLRAESNSNNWEDFDIRFKELHSDFYAELSKRFPDLSSYDKRLCAYLRMNLTTKEIASITHQNPMSLNTARTRLRRKLNLTQTNVNLNDFMSRI